LLPCVKLPNVNNEVEANAYINDSFSGSNVLNPLKEIDSWSIHMIIKIDGNPENGHCIVGRGLSDGSLLSILRYPSTIQCS